MKAHSIWLAVASVTAIACMAQFPALAQVPTGSPATSPEYYSANRKFSGEVAGGADSSLLVSIFKRDAESKAHHWSRKLLLDSENQSFVPTELRMLVTDDGKTAILRHGAAYYDRPAVHVVAATGQPLELYLDEIIELLPENLAAPEEFTGQNGRIFEVLLDDKHPATYGLWIQPANQWVALNLEKPALTLASGEVKARLQKGGLTRAREVVRAHQPGALQRVLQPLRRAVQGDFQGFAGTNPRAHIDDDTVAAYRFLAEQREPEDRKHIEALAAKPLAESVIFSTRYFGQYSPMNPVPSAHFVHSQARKLGDELLGVWDRWPQVEQEQQPKTWEDHIFGAPRRFGSVSGVVRLPFAERAESGSLIVCLIPEAVSQSEWKSHPDVIKLSTQRMGRGPATGRTHAGPSQYGFGFGTLTPGKYRLKAVWDHRPPHLPPRSEEVLAEPGDYESAETALLEVAAAERKKGLVLECTNRVGDAPVFFNNDEKWAAENPPEYDADAMGPGLLYPDQQRSRLKAISLSGAVLKTNSQERAVRVVGMSVIEQADWNTGERTRYALVKYFDPKRPKHDPQNSVHVTGKIVDEHGCTFEGNASSSSGRFHEIYFNPFPFAAKSHRFDIIETEHRFDNNGASEPLVRKLASFTITNKLALAAETLAPEKLPARRDLGKIAVELASLGTKAAEPEIHYGQPATTQPALTFWQDGEQSSAWRLESVGWRDRWGNRSHTPAAFCKEERALKVVARVARDFALAEFSEEETWAVPIEKVPGLGESAPLRLSRQWMGVRVELLAIGGPGEFSYEKGRLKEASKQITTPNRAGRFSPGARNFPGGDVQNQEPRIYFKTRGGPPLWMRPDQAVGIVARAPHLVYRAAAQDGFARFEILDQIELAEQEGPHYTPPNIRDRKGEVRFGALRLRPGQKEATLTIVAQKAQALEFVVDRPD